MWIKRFFQVFILILTVAFIGGCGGGVSNDSSTGSLPVIHINTSEGGNGSFTTSDGVKVNIEVPSSNSSGEVIVGESIVEVEDNPEVKKVSNGVSIQINLGRSDVPPPLVKVTITLPEEKRNVLKSPTLRLYRTNKELQRLEPYPCTVSIENGTVTFETQISGEYILLDDKLIYLILPPQSSTNKTRDVGYELPSKPSEINNGPIKFNYPLTNDTNTTITFLSKPDTKMFESTIKFFVDGKIKTTKYSKELAEGTSVYLGKFTKGIHKLDVVVYGIPINVSSPHRGLGIGNIGNSFHRVLFSTFFIVQPPPYSLTRKEIELLRKYSPVVEFGNYENLPYWQDKSRDWYGDYKEEYYLPIDLADLEVCEKGQELIDYESLSDYLPYWLTSEEIKEGYKPEQLLFVVCNRDYDSGNCYKVSLSKLVNFFGCSSGILNRGCGYEYAIAYRGRDGKFYANGAQFIVKKYMQEHNVPSTIYATLKKDDDYIYLQYWFYYAFDPKSPKDPQHMVNNFAQHPGDAENLTVVLDKKTRKPLWVFFAHHNDNQKFAYLGAGGEQIFAWNEERGIGGAIVSWNKIEKLKDKNSNEYTHPLIYIALGSHGIYFRKGAYLVDVPWYQVRDLFEIAGGGCRLAYVSGVDVTNKCDVTAKLKIISRYPVGFEENERYLLSPVNTIGDEWVEDKFQNDVRFFPYSEFFYSNEKLHCLDRVDTNNSLLETLTTNTDQALVGVGSVAPYPNPNPTIPTSNYDLIVGNIKLKAKDDYCKSILVDKYLFPPENYLPEEGDFLSIATNGNTVKIEGFVHPVYMSSRGNTDVNTYKEIVDLLPEEGYKLLVNWDVLSENSTWEEVEVFSKTVLLTGNVKFSSEHTYTTSGNHTIGLRLVTPNGAYVEKTYQIEIEEVKDKGNIQGAVKDAITKEPIEGVEVSLLNGNNTVAETITDANGNYNLTNVPVGNYTIMFTKEGYLPASGSVVVEANSTVTYPTLMQIDTEHSGNGTVQGIVKDAFNGQPVSGVTIKVFEGINNISGEPVTTISTSEDGFYQLELKAGYYTFLLSKDNYKETNYSLSVVGNTVTSKEFTISPILSANEVRIVLTWGETPPDLDAHLVKIKNGNQEYHLFWYYAESCPDHGDCHGSPTQEASLDIDDIHSFGPETITIHNIDANATYKYYVHDYSTSYNTGGGGEDSTVLANSGATVKVYWGDQTYTYYVPNLPGTAWKVFEIVNGTLIPCTGDNCVFVVSSVTDSQFGTRAITPVNPDVELFENLPAK